MFLLKQAQIKMQDMKLVMSDKCRICRINVGYVEQALALIMNLQPNETILLSSFFYSSVSATSIRTDGNAV
jgi:ABC-type phosphate/phosphonate transport system ATPase subunit